MDYTFQINEHSKLVLELGDLTNFEGDAIVNAANERMLGGGGVDGAIHRAAGRKLYDECLTVPEVEPGVRCPTGQARITKGYNLPAKHVIHTVGPIYESDQESAPLLASAYRSSLELANQHGLKSVAFPAISTGVFRYPKAKAAQVSLAVVAEAVGQLEEVYFILFGQDVLAAYQEAARKQFPSKRTCAAEEPPAPAGEPAVEPAAESAASPAAEPVAVPAAEPAAQS